MNIKRVIGLGLGLIAALVGCNDVAQTSSLQKSAVQSNIFVPTSDAKSGYDPKIQGQKDPKGRRLTAVGLN